jgi:hypothetical protein
MIKMNRIIAIVIILIYTCTNIPAQESKNIPVDNTQLIKQRGYSVEACYRIADDFLKSTTDQRKAIPYLEYILENQEEVKPDLYNKLARSYYFNGSFDLASKIILEYLEIEKSSKLKKEAKLELEKYENAKRIASNPENVVLMNLGTHINSQFPDINPYVSENENLLVFSSKRSSDYNIYVSKKNSLKTWWEEPKNAGNLVNTVNDEFVAGLSPDGSNLFVHYNEVSGFEDINWSHRSKGVYRELEDLGSKINTTYREEGICISKNGDSLFFASDRPGGYGGFDLYFCLKLPNELWGPAINMGELVNTPYDENYPNLSPDGKKLYFASKGHASIGGFDLFYSKYDHARQIWASPSNVGYPINNAFDNKNIAFTTNERFAYISNIDRNTIGDFDIYKIIFLDNEPDLIIVKGELFLEEDDEEIPFNSLDEQISITVSKSDETYGIYSFNKRNNSFVMALAPGEYIFEISSSNFEKYRKKIKIEENIYNANRRNIKIKLKKTESK